MPAHNVIVIAQPNARYLGVLERLPKQTSITVGNNVEAFRRAAGEANIVVNAISEGQILRGIWPELKRLQWIHSLSAGVENMLFPELVESEIPVTNARGVFKESLGEWVVGAVLFFAKDFRRLIRNQKESNWDQFDCDVIYRQSLGVVGYGEIGKAAARRAKALGMRIHALRRRPQLSEGDEIVDKFYAVNELEQLMADSDYVVAAAPLTPETRGLVSEAAIRAMKPTGVLMNVGRGPVIDEKAMIAALQEKRIRGAALDVFDVEPLPKDHPFWNPELNVLLSPHTADHTSTWLNETMEFFVENFERFDRGEPLQNIIDKRAGY